MSERKKATRSAFSFGVTINGRRQARTLNGITTSFVYDGMTPIQERQGATTTNLLTGPGIDEYLARSDGSTTRYFLPNHLGSTLALADPAGTITTRYRYSPFGETTQSGEGSSNPFQYTGRESDGTGLYYYRARYYDPRLQRFISSDPIGLAGGLNTYAYVANNPLRWTDPTGLAVFLCQRPADLPFPLNQFDHYWIKTDTFEAGMGGMRGGVPGQNGNSDRPYDPTQTVDHSGQSKASNASCEKQRNVDEQCVNDLIQPGQSTGGWNPYNQCQSFAYSTINRCRTGPQIPPSK